ncbi:unnamed protein product [Euphydryas editha]|uniref:Carboxylesterase type B domain-containing protein n=1 Tax=Euphydryas editha TaxID=104508 RepID=A0AAU9URN4_EUPED|nr:unnamed protein product [Euphydryas editha]
MYQVQVSEGTLKGKLSSTYNGRKYYSFEGIPYAKPPVGDLRFKAPQEPESWSGIRDATKPGNRCAQLNPLGKGTAEGSEDCLYLNIYTPVLPAEEVKKLPVLFFLHGGRLMLGYGDYYKPDFYIHQNVVLVTINYRLNIFGFLCLDLPDVPGNAGLKDTVMALKWVNRNIKNFNGDVDNVTVFGESAGAANGTSLLTSKMADGLFSKIICQSGNCLSDLYMVEEDNVEKASKIASFLGKDTRDKEELYDLFSKSSTEDLLNAYTSASMIQPPADIRAYLLPVVEKKFDNVERFFEEHPSVAIREKRFKNVPILATLNSEEAAFFVQSDENGNIIYEENLEHFIPKYLFIKENTPKSLEFVEKLRKFYFKGKNNGDKKLEYMKLLHDHYFARDIILFVEKMAKHQNVFLCRFAYSGNINTRVMRNLGLKGATHGDLVQYLFYRENKMKVANEKDLMLVDMFTEAWCNFAKTGKPNLRKWNLDWQPYDNEKKLCLNIEDDITIKPFPNYERIQFWLDLINEKSKL